MRIVHTLSFLLVVFSATAEAQSSLVYTPSSLTFPATPVGVSSAEQIVKITNSGTAPAVFSDYFVPSNYTIDYKPPTSIVPACNPMTDAGPNLAAGASCAIGIIYSPTTKTVSAPFGNNLSIDLCPPCLGTFYNLPLNATTGTGPMLKFSPALLTFPATPAGGSSTAQVAVTNTGNAAATISQFSSGSVFSESANTCYPAIAPGATCNIIFTFSPPATAAVGSVLTADVLNSPANPLGVVLQGGLTFPLDATGTVSAAAPLITVSPTTLPSVTAPINSVDVQAQSVTVTNAGKAAATLTISPQYTFIVVQKTANCATLAAGASCTFDVYFHPSALNTGPGTNGALIHVDYVEGTQSGELNVTFTGIATAPVLSLSPAAITVTADAGGADTQGPSVTLTNNGALPISNFTITAATFIIPDKTGNCQTLAPGASCTFDTYFRPPACSTAMQCPYSLNGTINVAFSAGANPGTITIPFTGIGNAPNNNPAVTVKDSSGQTRTTGANGLSFIQNVGTSQVQTISVNNTGKSNLNITGVALSGAADFQLRNNDCQVAPIPAGGVCSISISFAPANFGPATGTLTLTDNAPPGTQQITLNGNGTGPAKLTLSSSNLTFTTQIGGPPPPVVTIVVTNVGGSDAKIIGVGHSNTNAGFVMDSTSCQGNTLHPQATSGQSGYSCRLNIQFLPNAVGDVGDVGVVISDAPSSPNLFTLYGSGSCVGVQCPPQPAIPATSGYHLDSVDATSDPVDGATGNFYEDEADLYLGGPLGFNFVRYYSPGVSVGGYVSSLGLNWMNNFDLKVARNAASAQVILFRGKVVSFSKASGSWQLVAPSDIGYQFAEAPNGFQFMDPTNRLTYAFDSAGRLTGISNLSGYTLSVTQGDYGPTQVADGQGRTLAFTYANNLLASVQDQAGRTVAFAYDASGLLISSTAPDKAVTQYTYTTQGSNVGLMTRKQLPAGNALTTQTYDTSGKVIQQADGVGNVTAISYDGKGGAVIKSPMGAVTTQANDINGDIAGLQDPAGNSGKLTYDNYFRRTSMTDRLGNQISFTYHDPTGKLASITDEAGNTTSYTYTPMAQGAFTFYNLTGIQYADGTQSSFTYDANGRMTGQLQRDGTSRSFAYDTNGRLTSFTGTDGSASIYAYNSDSTLASRQDALGNATTFTYAPSKQIAGINDANGGVRAFTYDSAGRMLTFTDQLGNIRSVHYNANGLRDKWASPTSAVYTFGYDAMNRIAQYLDPLNNKTQYVYDADNRISSITNGAGETSKFTYDSVGHVLSLANNSGVIATYAYDAEGQLISRTDANGATASYAYGPTGSLIGLTAPSGNQWSMTYDKFGQMVSSTNPLGETKSLTRDAMGRVTAINLPGNLPGGIGTTTQFSARGQAAAITSPNGNTWTFNHDALGRISAVTDPLGNATTRSYTGNFITGMTFPLGAVAFTNDALGRIVKSVYSDGAAHNAAWDAAGMLVSSDGVSITRDAKGLPATVNGLGLTYNAADHPASVTYAPGKTVTYGYDADGHVTSVTDWVAGQTTIAYDPAGRPTSVTYPNGIATTYTYDVDGHVTGIASGSLASINLTRDADGKILSADRNLPTLPALETSTQSLTYDAAGRLNTTDASFDNMGRALAESGLTYTWNLANQLTGFSDGTNSVALTYDGLGEVSSSTATGTLQSFVFNHATDFPALSIVRQGVQQGGSDLRYYVYMPNGKVLYSVEAADNSRKFYHFDEMGNTAFLTGDDGSVTDTYAVTPYGDVADHVGQADNPFTWQGEYGVMQEAPGLYFLRNRHYDATLGRFLSPDLEIQSDPRSAEPYIYARGNPLVYVDPFGDLSWGDVTSFFGSLGSDIVNGAKAAGTALVNGGEAALAAIEAAGAKVNNFLVSQQTHVAAPSAKPPSQPSGPLGTTSSLLQKPAVLITNSAALRFCKKAKNVTCPADLVSDLQKVVDNGDGSTLIGQDRSGIISDNSEGLLDKLIGSGIISQDGSGVVSNDGGSVVSNDGGSVVSNDGGSVISNDGGSVISNDGGSVISNDGGSSPSSGGNGLLTDNGAALKNTNNLLTDNGAALKNTNSLLTDNGAAFTGSSTNK